MIQQKLDTLLASHTAPTLMGVKPANLVSLPRFETFEQMVQNYNAHLNQQDIYFHPVCQCNCKQLLLVYRKSELVKTLCEPQKRAFLLSYGYPVYHKNNVEPYFDEILTYLAQRVQSTKVSHMKLAFFWVILWKMLWASLRTTAAITNTAVVGKYTETKPTVAVCLHNIKAANSNCPKH